MTKIIKKTITDIIIILIVVSVSNVLSNNVGTVLASSNNYWQSNKKSVTAINRNSFVITKGTRTATIIKNINSKNDLHKTKVKLAGKQTAAYKAYKKLLLNGKDSIVLNTPGNIYKYFLKYVNANPDTYLFTLKDLNGDHIDELFIKDGKWDASYGYNSWVFSYNPNDKKIYNLIWDDIEGVCSYTPLKNGVLLQRYWYAGGQSDSFTFYKLGSDNKENKVKELNYFVGDWAEFPPYSIDQKEVTKEKWNKVLKSDFTNNKISKNQWHKCNKKSIQKYLNYD